MVKSIANFISNVSNPLFITVPFSFALIFKTSDNLQYALHWTFISGIFATTVGAFVLYGVKKGFFSNLDVSKRIQRPPLFIFTAVMSLIYLLITLYFKGPQIILFGLAVLLLGIFIAEIVNTKIKASMHLAVYSSFCLALGIIYGGEFWTFTLFIPAVAWSRITLKRHTLPETIAGTTLGLSIVFVSYLVIKYLLIR
ncbi:MAG TPA: hypothetical protein VG965_04785 [Patescibacteria group bacterium]|nr:hypothetical protein [Patescibacteria group bacterium]